MTVSVKRDDVLLWIIDLNIKDRRSMGVLLSLAKHYDPAVGSATAKSHEIMNDADYSQRSLRYAMDDIRKSDNWVIDYGRGSKYITFTPNLATVKKYLAEKKRATR
jgi:hypothetical protein